MMTVGSDAKLSVCSDFNLNRQLSVDSDEDDEEEDGDEEEVVPVAPDGGWGWVVVLAGFMVHFLLDGINYTFGIMLTPIVEDFNSEPETVVWAGSLLIGVNMLSGPIVGGLVNRYGCRPVAIIGSVVAGTAMAVATLTTDVVTFIIIYGVVGGLGFGMVFLPAIVCVGLYFESKRALATGIAVCGAGIGAFVFAPLANFLVENIGWRNSNLIFSGLCFLNVFCGLVMRPLEVVTNEEANNVDVPEDERVKKLSIMNHDPMPTIGENEIFDEEEEDSNEEEDDDNNNNAFKVSPTKLHHNNITRNMSLNISQQGDKINRNYSTPYLRPVPSVLSMMSSRERKTSSASIKMIRPMSRADIFYSGSIRQITDENNIDSEIIGLRSNRQSFVSIGASQRSRGSFNSLVIPRNCLNAENSDSKKDQKDKVDGKSMMTTLKTMVNVSLLADPKFLLIGISNLFGFLGFFVPFLYVPSMASDKENISVDQSALLLSVIGISNTFGRIGCGYISDFSWVDSLFVTNISFFLTGICIFIFPFLNSFTEYIILCLIFGLCIASLVTLTSIVLVDVLGIERLTSAFGILIMFRGIATILGPPIAGMVYEAAKSYSASFFVSGCFLLVAGVISFIADVVRRRERQAPCEQS